MQLVVLGTYSKWADLLVFTRLLDWDFEISKVIPAGQLLVTFHEEY